MINNNIVIKAAFKGSSIVTMEGYKQLYNETWKTRNSNLYWHVPLVTKILDHLHKETFINAKQKFYLRGSSEPRTRRFYLLPKIHEEPEKWSKPHEILPPTVRPTTQQSLLIIIYILYQFSTKATSKILMILLKKFN